MADRYRSDHAWFTGMLRRHKKLTEPQFNPLMKWWVMSDHTTVELGFSLNPKFREDFAAYLTDRFGNPDPRELIVFMDGVGLDYNNTANDPSLGEHVARTIFRNHEYVEHVPLLVVRAHFSHGVDSTRNIATLAGFVIESADKKLPDGLIQPPDRWPDWNNLKTIALNNLRNHLQDDKQFSVWIPLSLIEIIFQYIAIW